MSNKVLIIGDCHFGVRSGNPIYFDYFSKFYKHLIEYIDENKITTIIQLGDLFDKRKSIDFLSLKTAQEQFLIPCEKRNIKLYVISGNHDCYYKSTNEVNSVQLLKTSNMVVIDQYPVTDSINGVDFDFYPWINESLLQESVDKMNTSKSKFAVGHFEFKNFRLHKHQIADVGMDHKVCKNYKLVFSGHYHCISRKDNILYCGTPYELDWNDWNDKKGIWVFDTSNEDLEFVETPFRLYEKIDYDEIDIPDISEMKNKFIKLVIKNKTNQYRFDTFFQSLMNMKPYDVQVIDDEISKSVQQSMNSEIEFQSTPDMILHIINHMETSLDKNILKKMIAEVYVEAEALSKV